MTSSAKRSAGRRAEVRVALLDDHPAVLNGFEQMVNNMEGYRVVLKAKNGAEFIKALPGAGRIGIALVDLNMPVMDGYEVMAWIKSNEPQIHALAITFSNDAVWYKRSMEAGACGYLLKTVDHKELRAAFDEVTSTGRCLGEIDLVVNPAPDPIAGIHVEGEITIHPRELEFMRLSADPKEFTYEQIAEFMKVTRHAVDGYFRSLGKRLGLHSRPGLVAFALRHGLASTLGCAMDMPVLGGI